MGKRLVNAPAGHHVSGEKQSQRAADAGPIEGDHGRISEQIASGGYQRLSNSIETAARFRVKTHPGIEIASPPGGLPPSSR